MVFEPPIKVDQRVHTHTPISEEVLEAAGKITLADLLESPAYSPWIVSAFGNANRLAHRIEGTDSEEDEFLQFRVYKIFNMIPDSDRKACFNTVRDLVWVSKKDRDQ